MTVLIANLALAALAVYAVIAASVRWYNTTRWRECVIRWSYGWDGLSRPPVITLEGQARLLHNGDYRFRFLRPAPETPSSGDDDFDNLIKATVIAANRWGRRHSHTLHLEFDSADDVDRLIDMVEASS